METLKVDLTLREFPEGGHEWFPQESNEIRVTSAGARELRIYFHEKMVDLSRPVIVNVSGLRSRHDVKPSLQVLLESARRDRGLLYTAAVNVRVP